MQIVLSCLCFWEREKVVAVGGKGNVPRVLLLSPFRPTVSQGMFHLHPAELCWALLHRRWGGCASRASCKGGAWSDRLGQPQKKTGPGLFLIGVQQNKLGSWQSQQTLTEREIQAALVASQVKLPCPLAHWSCPAIRKQPWWRRPHELF